MNNNGNLDSFYYDILNISKKTNALDTINNIVLKNKQDLKGAVGSVEGLCKVASNNISLELRSKNIMHRVLNTEEILGSYEHVFIIACYKENERLNYVLIDPTYEQFCAQSDRKLTESFSDWPAKVLSKTAKGRILLYNLLTKGYSNIGDDDAKIYLGSFINRANIDEIDLELNNVITGNISRRTR